MTENQPPMGATPARKTDPRSVLIGAGIVLVLVVGFAAGRWLHPASSPPATTSTAAAPASAPPAATAVTTAAPASALTPVDAAAPSTAAISQAAPVAAPQPSGSVVGNWTGKFQWNNGPLSPMTWQFNPDGTLVSTSGPAGKQSQSMWAWRQRGNEVEMYLAGNTFYGTINGSSMTGTMRVVFKNGGTQNTGIFDAMRSQ
ncbi:MAG: hypothetical protein ABSE43_15315 [Steroidobacteraceae bacterium]|jgi:hypothetical protein